ncbi:NADH-quinone oxidoreductase subunit C [Streptomyces sp. NPDC006645]|uniref:NADH-quinone oxidoreductase subunit C n=1 Tax=unclassified Streptomyces TaxID=2593676 RepID=UPI0033A2BED0
MTSDAHDAYDSLPGGVTEIFGADATAEHAYDLLTVDVPAADWLTALETARDRLGCTYFDWLSAVDEPGAGFRVSAHVASVAPRAVRRLLVRTTVPHEAAELPTAIGVYAGAGWHERETYEMFGVTFTDHPNLVHLLLPEAFEGHPLRKDFVLAARVAKAWPGAKEPGESAPGHAAPKRRQMLPPGVPDPNEWGPLKGQLPPAPTRPARTARAAADRPPRRTRSVSEGSTTQQPPTPEPSPTPTPAPWHAPTPAFDPPTEKRDTAPASDAGAKPSADPTPDAGRTPRLAPGVEPTPDSRAEPAPESESPSGTTPKPAPDAEAQPPAEQTPAPATEPGQDPEPDAGRAAEAEPGPGAGDSAHRKGESGPGTGAPGSDERPGGDA